MMSKNNLLSLLVLYVCFDIIYGIIVFVKKPQIIGQIFQWMNWPETIVSLIIAGIVLYLFNRFLINKLS